MESIGGKTELPGFGKLEIIRPAIVANYDRQKLDRLVATLVVKHPEIAQRLVECRSESSRAGGLRIIPAKPPSQAQTAANKTEEGK